MCSLTFSLFRVDLLILNKIAVLRIVIIYSFMFTDKLTDVKPGVKISTMKLLVQQGKCI